MHKITNYFFIILVTLGTSLHAISLENEKLFTIHGIFGSPWNMYYLAGPLENEKMDITHWGYPSRDKKIVEHGADLVLELQKTALENPGQPIHFMTHSMGGLILLSSEAALLAKNFLMESF